MVSEHTAHGMSSTRPATSSPRAGYHRVPPSIFKSVSTPQLGYRLLAAAIGRGDGELVPEWHYRAACAGTDPELWFPERVDTRHMQQRRKQICAGCPVREECLRDQMAWEETNPFCTRNRRYGHYGGVGPAERHRLAATERAVIDEQSA